MKDSIAAIATGPSAGAVGILRLSGENTLKILSKIIRPLPDFAAHPRRQFYCKIVEEDGKLLDDGLVSYFAAPKSYTGEDSAELGLHGNPLLLRRVLKRILETGLCRPAEPGEFTKRAYLNGRLDLTQAEAVHSIITARSEYELAAARKNFYGELSRLMSHFRSSIIHLKAETEAEVDFADEDLSFESKEKRIERITDLLSQIDALLQRAGETEQLRNGFQVALAGVPNAGKSSLLNLLLGWDRAIVSPSAGTTRDFLSEELNFDGIRVRFVDTAGLHKTTDSIEQEGIRMSEKMLKESHLVLHLIDGERYPYELPDLKTKAPVLRLLNKCDLLPSTTLEDGMLAISCKTKEGIATLKERIRSELLKDSAPDPLLLEDRHRYHFMEIRRSLRQVLRLWKEDAPDEIVALELDTALEHTGRMTGRIDTEEVLGRIFSVFCVGK